MQNQIRTPSSFASLIFLAVFGVGAAVAYAAFRATGRIESAGIGVAAFAIALVLSLSIKVADQWERVVVLRFGKFHGLNNESHYHRKPWSTKGRLAVGRVTVITS